MTDSYSMKILRRLQNNESGFTLIELLVVILIIGVLAAIAIPVFLNQQKAAVDTRTTSDMKTAQVAITTWIANNPNASSFSEQKLANEIFNSQRYSDGTTIAVYGKPADWCLRAYNTSGNQYNAGDKYIIYKSATGKMGSAVQYGVISSSSCYNDPATRYAITLQG